MPNHRHYTAILLRDIANRALQLANDIDPTRPEHLGPLPTLDQTDLNARFDALQESWASAADNLVT